MKKRLIYLTVLCITASLFSSANHYSWPAPFFFYKTEKPNKAIQKQKQVDIDLDMRPGAWLF